MFRMSTKNTQAWKVGSGFGGIAGFVLQWSRTLLACLVLYGALASANQDVILVLDNSGSMKKNDPEFLATSAVSEFIKTLESETHAGVIIFDQRVTLAVPLTPVEGPNQQLLVNSLDDINYRGQLTDSPAAVERAIYELKTNARPGADKFIVFMTDGIVDTGNAAADVEKTKWLREELAVDAADNDIKVLAVAFTENADFFLIQSLAKKTGGDYFRALTPADLSGVFAEIHTRIMTPAEPEIALQAAPDPVPETTAGEPATSSEAPVEPAGEVTAEAANEDSGAPMGASADGGDLLAQIPPEDLEALREISEIEGIPIEQLARELYGDGDADNQPGVVVSRPGEPSMLVEAEQGAVSEPGSLGLLIAAAIGLLLLVLFVVWMIRRKKAPADATDGNSLVTDSTPKIETPPAFLHDISGVASEPLVNLDANTLMIGRVAGTPDEHLKYLVINAPTVGRRHALIKYKDKSYWLQDQGSVNGTYVNDKRLSGECQLRHGDRLRFHNAEFEFTQPDIADAGETMIAEALPGEETIVADATVMGTIAAGVAGVAAANQEQVVPEGEPEEGQSASVDDMFDSVPEDAELDETLDASDDSRLNEPGVPAEFRGEEIADDASTSIDDIFDVTGEDAIPAVGEELEDDDFSEDLTELNPDSSGGGESMDAFDAEASAFFDDNTVGPVVEGDRAPDPTTTNFNADSSADSSADEGLFSVDGGDAHDLDQEALDERLERARALAESEEVSAPTQQIDVNHMDTMLNMEAPAPEDPNDVTLDDFIETDTFKAPLTQTPDIADEPEDVSLEKFIDTTAMNAEDVAETMVLNEPPEQQAGDESQNSDQNASEFDADASAFFDEDDDNSEDPTEIK